METPLSAVRSWLATALRPVAWTRDVVRALYEGLLELMWRELIHGEADWTVPVRFGRRVFEAANGEKEALFLPGGGHVDLYDRPEVPSRVVDFIRRQVPAAG